MSIKSKNQRIETSRRNYAKHAVHRARLRALEGGAVKDFADPRPLLRGLSDDFDDVIITLFSSEPGGLANIAVVALGSYGRQELFPYSDIDLLIVHHQQSEELIERVVEAVVYPLWDAGVTVGHAVRGIDETLDLASEDLTLRTALLDARLVVGDEGPFHSLSAGAYREIFGPERLADFQDLLLSERRSRHQRFGETVYLLEPNIKSGAGGLRDINLGLWAAKAKAGVHSLEELADAGIATLRGQNELIDAHRFLQHLRFEMHRATGRAQDRLLFEIQEQLGPRLFPAEEIPGKRRSSALAPAVERLMHAYYRAARVVVLETEGLLQRCLSPDLDRKHARSLFSFYEDRHGSLVCVKPEIFWDEPSQLLKVFEIAAKENLRISRQLQDTIAEASAGEPGSQLMVDEEAISLWRELLLRPESAEGVAASLLERMHDLGVLVALIPEFEPCTGRVQHDLYHVYTVDRHSLAVVTELKSLCFGSKSSLFSEHAYEVASEIVEHEWLFLAGLLHDIAKPLGQKHDEKGARIALGVCARLGLTPRAQQAVAFLVLHHLDMQHISQRRDLSDASVIQRFAHRVASVEQLRRLYLLALADTAMTAPGNLTEWKRSLLRELYERTLYAIEHPVFADYEQEEDGHRARRDDLKERLIDKGFDTKVVSPLMSRLPHDYFLQPLDRLVSQTSVLLDYEASDALTEIGTDQHDEKTTRLTICCQDRPGLLSEITGVMILHRIDVLGAQVFTIKGKRHEDIALDLFWVPTPIENADDVWRAFKTSLEDTINGKIDLDEEVALRTKPSSLGKRVLPHVETEVRISADLSPKGVLLELQTADRPGLLHVVTRALNDLSLAIVASRVSTEAGKVIDSFYLRDRQSGELVYDQKELEAIVQAVRDAVADLAVISNAGDSNVLLSL